MPAVTLPSHFSPLTLLSFPFLFVEGGFDESNSEILPSVQVLHHDLVRWVRARNLPDCVLERVPGLSVKLGT